MNKFFLYGLAAIFAISACKKTKKDEPATPTPQGQNEIPTGPDGKGGSIPATSDIYLFGKNGLPSSNYVLWTADAKFDNFLNYDLSPMAIEGLFIQGNKLNASKSVNFFGSHMISQNKYRISYFSKDKYYHLAEELKVPISNNFTEAFVAYAHFQKNLYMLAESFGASTMQYYYRISEKGEFSVHELTPNIDYNLIAGSNNGAVLAKAEPRLLWTELDIYRDKNKINNFKLEKNGYSFISLLDMQLINDQTLFFNSSARRDSDESIQYLFITINLQTKVTRIYTTSHIPANSTVGSVFVSQGKPYIPVTANATGECFYISLALSEAGTPTVDKVQLETVAGTTFHADQVFIEGNDVYVMGGEGDLPCYWKNKKLVRLKHNGVGSGYASDIRK
ncbi:hypothetical protein WAE58_20750 [Pedobacter panaciterrae]|uniref:TolB-like protein n=1 Tax=Pedobacter panaciterrae TaxID=363849 RepID=A0ABU8NRL2_9SPHI|nr:hypothetical protein [uncultured Pedobacter sp.]